MSRVGRVTDSVEALLASAASGLLGSFGVDAVDIADFERDIVAAGDAFLAHCFTTDELEHCKGNVEKLASRFAIKEAALKALGTGIRGIGLHDIVVETDSRGEPRLHLSDSASAVAASRRLCSFRCSATHEGGLALAVVAASGSRQNEGAT